MKTETYITNPAETDHERVIRKNNLEATYSVEDFVNPESFDPRAPWDRAYVLLDGGVILAIVFAEYPAYCEQDALDEAADSGKLDTFKLGEGGFGDYEDPEDSPAVFLGNDSAPFDLDSLECWEVPLFAFEQDPALMTLDRVVTRLETAHEWAERAANRTPADSPEWLPRYQAEQAYEHALLLCRFAGAR